MVIIEVLSSLKPFQFGFYLLHYIIPLGLFLDNLTPSSSIFFCLMVLMCHDSYMLTSNGSAMETKANDAIGFSKQT